MILAALALALPASVQYMIDDLIPHLVETAANGIDWTPALLFGIVLIGIYFFRVIFSLAQDYLATRIGASLINDIRIELFAHLETVSFRFYQQHQMGEIISRILSDASRIQNLLASTLLRFLQNILLLVGILVYLLFVDWKLTLVALAPVPLTIVFSNFFGVKAHGIARKLQETIASFQGRLQESLGGLRTVRAFGQEDAETDKVTGLLVRLRGLYIQSAIVSSSGKQFRLLSQYAGTCYCSGVGYLPDCCWNDETWRPDGILHASGLSIRSGAGPCFDKRKYSDSDGIGKPGV